MADCYRVTMRAPTGSKQSAAPIISALSMEEAIVKALGILPGYAILGDPVWLHSSSFHSLSGWAAMHVNDPAGPAPEQPRAGIRDDPVE